MHATVVPFVRSLVRVCLQVLSALLLASISWAASTAEQLFERAQKAERKGELVTAYVLYAEAAAANPNNITYWQHAQALRPTATLSSVTQPKLSVFDPEQMDPTLFGSISPQDLDQARKPLPPVHLKALPDR